MFKTFSLIITILLLCSCALHTQRIIVPSKNFSMQGPPSDWKTLLKSELAEFPIEPYDKIPGGVFTALWSKDNSSKIGFVAAVTESKKVMLPGAVDIMIRQGLRGGLNEDIEELKRTECRKNFEYTIDSERENFLTQDIKMYELEASITCTSLRAKHFIKILLYMFYKDKSLYSFELMALQSDFNNDRKVLDAMIDSFTFIDQVPETLVSAATDSKKKSHALSKSDQAVVKKYINIQEADVVFAYGEVKYILKPGDTLEVVRTKTCRSGSGECWIVKHVLTGNTGAVSAKRMQSQHKVYSAQQPNLDSIQSYDSLPPRTFIEIQQPDKVLAGGKLKYTVTAGDTLEVLLKKTCKSGHGECWGVQNMETKKFGFVKADKMHSKHRVYTDPEKK